MAIVAESVDVPKVVKVSGETIKISGEHVTITNGTSDVLFSGYMCTNTLVYSGVGFTTYNKATILLQCLNEGSGVYYNIRGYPVSGVTAFSLTSGQLTSGQLVRETLTDTYDWVDVGVENTVDNYTGVVTVTTSRR